MTVKETKLKALLDKEVCSRNNSCELSYAQPDPLLIASRYKDEYIILLCALYGYGKASLIVKFLDLLPFELLKQSEAVIQKELRGLYYRFQNEQDVIQSFITIRRMQQEISLNDLFVQTYIKEHSVLEALDSVIYKLQTINDYESYGLSFLFGKPLKRDKNNTIKTRGNAPYKRWMMYLRWMVRTDNLDLGLWQGISKADLILPLDTHTFKVSQQLGLLKRKTYDLQAALEVTEQLKTFDANDPIKYDFALYRIGQEKIL